MFTGRWNNGMVEGEVKYSILQRSLLNSVSKRFKITSGSSQNWPDSLDPHFPRAFISIKVCWEMVPDKLSSWEGVQAWYTAWKKQRPAELSGWESDQPGHPTNLLSFLQVAQYNAFQVPSFCEMSLMLGWTLVIPLSPSHFFSCK